SSYRIASFVVSGIYCLLGVSGLFAVIFKKYALAKNFSVLWWTVTIVTTILSIVNIVLLATRGKEEIMSKCETNYATENYGPESVEQCAKYWVIVTGVYVAIQFVVMSIGGWVASRYTSEVKHQNEGLAYTYGKGYGPVHPQPQPHHSAAHPYTNIGAKNEWRAPSRRINSKLLSISLVVVLFAVATGPRNADTAGRNTAVVSDPSESQANVIDGQVVLTSQEVCADGANEDFNPQQTASTNQIIDTNTYGSHTPDTTYLVSDHERPSSLPVGPRSEIDHDIHKSWGTCSAYSTKRFSKIVS
ncbi:hypothetical protein BGX21_009720, partial [Mortierella sp. AD011]